MKSLKLFARAAMVMVAVFLFCIVSITAGAADKPIMLKVSTFFSPQDDIAIALGNWCKEVEKRTSGRIKTRFYPGATLAPRSSNTMRWSKASPMYQITCSAIPWADFRFRKFSTSPLASPMEQLHAK